MLFFCWYGGFPHRTESDFLLFLLIIIGRMWLCVISKSDYDTELDLYIVD